MAQLFLCATLGILCCMQSQDLRLLGTKATFPEDMLIKSLQPPSPQRLPHGVGHVLHPSSIHA